MGQESFLDRPRRPRPSSDRVNTNLSAPSGLGTSELLLPRPVVAVGAVVGVVGVVVDERGHVDDDEAERVPQRRDDAQRAARLLAAERCGSALEAQRRRELAGVDAARAAAPASLANPAGAGQSGKKARTAHAGARARTVSSPAASSLTPTGFTAARAPRRSPSRRSRATTRATPRPPPGRSRTTPRRRASAGGA